LSYCTIWFPNAKRERKGVQDATRATVQQIHVLNAGNEREFDGVYGSFNSGLSARTPSLTVGASNSWRGRHAMRCYQFRDFVAASGLMNYGPASPKRIAR
jgi:hypothetical protein